MQHAMPKLEVSENIATVSERIIRFINNRNNWNKLIDGLITYIENQQRSYSIVRRLINMFGDPQRDIITTSKLLLEIKDLQEVDTANKKWLVLWLSLLSKPWKVGSVGNQIIKQTISTFSDFVHTNEEEIEDLTFLKQSLLKRGLVHVEAFEKQQKMNAEIKATPVKRTAKKIEIGNYCHIATTLKKKDENGVVSYVISPQPKPEPPKLPASPPARKDNVNAEFMEARRQVALLLKPKAEVSSSVEEIRPCNKS